MYLNKTHKSYLITCYIMMQSSDVIHESQIFNRKIKTFTITLLLLLLLSSSLARQPYVGPGLPQKLLPAEVSSYYFFRFRDKSLFQGGLSAPRPTPGYPGGPMFYVRVVSLSRKVPILKHQDLAFLPPYKCCPGAMTLICMQRTWLE
jgi:hypothetical protein